MNTEKNEPYGVGGWLALLVVGLTILGPLLEYGMIWNSYAGLELANYAQTGTLELNQLQKNVKSIDILYFLINSLLSMMSGFILLTKYQPIAVRFCIGAFFARGLLVPVIAALHVNNLEFVDASTASAVINDTVSAIVRNLFVAGAWTAYLLLSKRVKNTYYTEN